MNPGTPEFIARYPFQVQEFIPYQQWREIEAQNFSTEKEAEAVLWWWKKHGKKNRLRVVDTRTGERVPVTGGGQATARTCNLCCRNNLKPSEGSSRKRGSRIIWVCFECQKYVLDLAKLSLKKGITLEAGHGSQKGEA